MDLWQKIEDAVQEKRMEMWRQLSAIQSAEAEKLCMEEMEAEKARLLALNPGDELEIVEAGSYEVRDLNGVFTFKTWKLMRGLKMLKSNRVGLPRRNGDSAAKTRDWRELSLRQTAPMPWRSSAPPSSAAGSNHGWIQARLSSKRGDLE